MSAFYDPAESSDASYWPHPIDEIEPVPESDQAKENHEVAVRLLQLFTRVQGYRIRAIAYLRLIGCEDRSLEEIAKAEGVTRQAIDKVYRECQRQTGLKGRGDKSDDARETYREINLGKKRSKPSTSGAFYGIFNNATN